MKKLRPRPEGPTGIDYILRAPQQATAYRPGRRLRDGLAGYRDASRLTPAQAKAATRAGQPADPGSPPGAVLPSWAVAQIEYLQQIKLAESLVAWAMTDALAIELARHRETGAAAAADLKAAEAAAAGLQNAGPEPAVAAGPGEAHDSEAVLTQRRATEHAAALAARQGQVAAARERVRAAAAAATELAGRISNIDQILETRQLEAEKLTRRRLAVYARGLARRRPDAPVLYQLTEGLVLPARPDKQRRPDTGTGPGSAP
jgi:hypothetical protein